VWYGFITRVESTQWYPAAESSMESNQGSNHQKEDADGNAYRSESWDRDKSLNNYALSLQSRALAASRSQCE
jgi:hypothetical protein